MSFLKRGSSTTNKYKSSDGPVYFGNAVKYLAGHLEYSGRTFRYL